MQGRDKEGISCDQKEHSSSIRKYMVRTNPKKIAPQPSGFFVEHDSKVEDMDNEVIKKLDKTNMGTFVEKVFEAEGTRNFKCGRILVEVQILDHADPEMPFHHVCAGTLDGLKAHVEELLQGKDANAVTTLLSKRDGAGACLIHLAYLFERFDIGHYLLQLNPVLSVAKYGYIHNNRNVKFKKYLPYMGENILHMAIAKRNYNEVKYLFEFYTKIDRPDLITLLLKARTKGHFFQPDDDITTVYFGEYPILFAVCANDIDILDLVLEYSPWDAIFTQDSHYNNALHLCVLNNQIEMFSYVMKMADYAISVEVEKYFKQQNKEISEQEKKSIVKRLVDDRILNVINEDGHTPFTLAAVKGTTEMFNYLVNLKKTIQWCYGPVTCAVVSLKGFDIPEWKDPIEQTKSGPSYLPDPTPEFNKFNSRDKPLEQDVPLRCAIEWICIENRLELIEIPEVKEIITKKWQRFGFRQFLFETMYAVTITTFITLIIAMYAYSEGRSAIDWFAWALYPFTWILLLIHLYYEIPEIWHHGIDYWGFYGGVRGAAQLSNICMSTEFVLFTLVCASKFYNWVHEIEDDSLTRIAVALSALTSWIYMYFFLMGFEATGKFVVIVSNILMRDIPRFLQLYVVLLFGFGTAQAVLSTDIHEKRVGDGFWRLFGTIWKIFNYTLDGGNTDAFQQDDLKFNTLWLFEILRLMYNLLIVLLLLNLLIAMMSSTYENLLESAPKILLREQYNIMCSFERALKHDERLERRKAYSLKHGGEDVPTHFEMQTYNDGWILSASDNFEANTKVEGQVNMPTAMRELAVQGKLTELQDMLAKDISLVNSRDAAGGTLLHWACFKGHIEIVTMLVEEFHADVNATCHMKKTPLHDAVNSYCAEVAKIREGEPKDMYRRYSSIIRLLIDNGANPFARDAEQNSPFFIAKKRRVHKLEEILQDVGKAYQVRQETLLADIDTCRNRVTHKEV